MLRGALRTSTLVRSGRERCASTTEGVLWKCSARSASVASKAAAAGHSVSMFLASDGVQCLTDDVISSLEGVGTGKLSETYPACVAAGVTFYVSGMSCKARGITPESLATKNAGGGPVTFEMPPKLLELTFAADSTLSF